MAQKPMLRGEVGARVARLLCNSPHPLPQLSMYAAVSGEPLSVVRPSEFLAQSTDGVMTVTGLARSVFSGVLDGHSQMPLDVGTRNLQE